MKLPLFWLKDYVAVTNDADSIAKIINDRILEIESIHNPGKEIKNVIVAQIAEVNKHPQADKLHLLKVNTGTELLQVVCGASNVAVGKKIAFATSTAELPGGFKMKVAKIRGIESYGMCCSEKELGLAQESQGILHLPEDAPLGKDFVEYYGLNNAIYDVAILPNRGDAQSLRSMAIEVHAATGAPLKLPLIETNVKEGDQYQPSITIEKPELCNRYMSAILHVKVKESPQWLKERIQSVGLRPINNVVDITNFVLWEIGQPLHAFDYTKLAQGQIIVRTAREGETITTLDGSKIILKPEMLVIADAEKPLALAGIMGGADSGVTGSTTTILLESAYFNPTSIRRTSKYTAVRSDSSTRFEKGIAYEGVADGFYRAIQLFAECAEGKLVSPIVDNAPVKPTPVRITLDPKYVERILGIEVSLAEIKSLFEKLQFGVTEANGVLEIVVPSGRTTDIYRPIDLVEEVIRNLGYDRLPSILPETQVKHLESSPREKLIANVHNILRAAGLNETMSYSMTSSKVYEKIGLSSQFNTPINIVNPITEELSVMRQSLLPQLIEAVAFNRAQQVETIALYEIGTVFTKEKETTKVAGIIYGNPVAGFVEQKPFATDVYAVKGILENILETCGLEFKKLNRSKQVLVHPGKSFEFVPLKLVAGELSPIVCKKLDLLQPAYVFEFDLEQLIVMSSQKRIFRDLPQFPGSARDVAFVIDRAVAVADVEKVMRKAAGEIVEHIELFDRYTGEKIAQDKMSLAYSIMYRAKDKTLTDAEITAAHSAIVTALKTELKVELRA